MRMYTGYSIIILISTVFNIVMTKNLHVSHYKAWVCTLLWTGIVNYFILKHIWSFGGNKSEGAGSGAGSSSSKGGGSKSSGASKNILSSSSEAKNSDRSLSSSRGTRTREIV